jgi:hypothetical protein
MSLDYTNKKFIISSGCSYGGLVRYIVDYTNNDKLKTDLLRSGIADIHKFMFDYYDDNLIIINLDIPGQSSTYIADSVIRTVNVLKSKDVPLENIYVNVEWTLSTRISYIQPHNLSKDYFDFSFEHWTPNINSKLSNIDEIRQDLYNDINIQMDFNYNFSLVSIDDQIHLLAHSAKYHHNSYEKSDELSEYLKQAGKFYESCSAEMLVNNYLNDVLRLQYFLKYLKINYDFYNMNSFFSAWVDRGDFVSQSYYNGQNPYIWKLENDKVMIQKNINYDNKLSRDNDLPNVLPMFTSKIGEIDFKYWWFYNKNGYRFGGIDEYALDNFDWYGYSVYIQPTHQNQIPAFNNHPSEWVYVMLSNYAMKHNNFMTVSKKYQSYLLNKIKEEIENPTDDNYLINPIIRHWKS